jgi:2-phospho-L-lactate guanylyltransferase
VTCWTVVPVKAPGTCKSRLGGVLDERSRSSLVGRWLRHVVETAMAAPAVDEVFVLGPSRHDLDASVPLLADPGTGLNNALASALAIAAASGVDRLLFVSADLPEVTGADFSRLASAAGTGCGIAPDHHGLGTNALALALPSGCRFNFAYGPSSFSRHVAEASRLRLPTQVIHSPTLARDIDEPADLLALGATWST